MTSPSQQRGISHETGVLADLVNIAPNRHQPIFGRPQFAVIDGERYEQLLTSIKEIYQNLEIKLGRRPRVLDLSCNVGFFSFSLADAGAIVHGVERDDHNLAVCVELAAEHPELQVTFQKALNEEVIVKMAADQYDLVLGLSCFHELIQTVGIPLAQKVISDLAAATSIGIYEFKHSEAFLFWAAPYPPNSRLFLNAYEFVHRLDSHSAEHSLYVASNRYWSLGPYVGTLPASTLEPLQTPSSIRVFAGEGLEVQYLKLPVREPLSKEHQSLTRALAFLKRPPAGFRTPKLLAYHMDDQEIWLLYGKSNERTLLEKITEKAALSSGAVITNVLDQLVALETAGLYHTDLSMTSILLAEDDVVSLTNYAAISDLPDQIAWPGNRFLNFMIVMFQAINAVSLTSYKEQLTALDPNRFPEPYLTALWRFLERKPEQWSFALLRQLFTSETMLETANTKLNETGFIPILRAAEQALKAVGTDRK